MPRIMQCTQLLPGFRALNGAENDEIISQLGENLQLLSRILLQDILKCEGV